MVKRIVIASAILGTLGVGAVALASTQNDVKPVDNHKVDCRHLTNDQAKDYIKGKGDSYKECHRPYPTPSASPTPTATPVPTTAPTPVPTTVPTVINNTTNTTVPATTTPAVVSGGATVQTPSTGVLPDTGGSAQ